MTSSMAKKVSVSHIQKIRILNKALTELEFSQGHRLLYWIVVVSERKESVRKMFLEWLDGGGTMKIREICDDTFFRHLFNKNIDGKQMFDKLEHWNAVHDLDAASTCLLQLRRQGG